MPEIILKNITKKFNKSVAVDNLNLKIEDGSYVTLLGPSGCGKTTTLRMIAGLETPTEGEIYINGNLVFSSEKGIDITPDKRGIGFLFQNYALWPHMTVYKNIAFGLENLKWKKREVQNRVSELLDMMQISEYADRYPSELSGGQQQRVAIARTLATNPSVLLMDEPLSNLDAKLRLDMRAELKRLHQNMKSTFVYVTHDQQEAMALSTQICLLKNGLLQQYCEPLEIYGNPVNEFVSDFVGSPSINLMEFEYTNENGKYILHNENMDAVFYPEEQLQDLGAKRVVIGIRPEFIDIKEDGDMAAEVYSSFPSGMETTVIVKVKNEKLTAVVFGSKNYTVGQSVKLSVSSRKCIMFDAKSKIRLGLGAFAWKK